MYEILDEEGYKKTIQAVKEFEERLAIYIKRFKDRGYTDEEIKNVTEPMISFYDGFKEDIEIYEKHKGIRK